MSGVHERMQTDYIWLKDHSAADDYSKARYLLFLQLILRKFFEFSKNSWV